MASIGLVPSHLLKKCAHGLIDVIGSRYEDTLAIVETLETLINFESGIETENGFQTTPRVRMLEESFTCNHLIEASRQYFEQANQESVASQLSPKASMMGPAATLAFDLAYGLITTLGIILNVIVAAAIWTDKSGRKGLRVYLLSLAVADVLLVASCAPSTKIEFMEQNFPTQWPGISCSLLRGLQAASLFATVMNILLIAIERYTIDRS